MWDVTATGTTLTINSVISTHTSRVGCDGEAKDFNDLVDISTHTSRVGCDKSDDEILAERKNFYSHIPCGM